MLAKSLDEPKCASQIHNALMLAPRRSPLIGKMLALALQRVQQRWLEPRLGDQACYGIAGPSLIGLVIKQVVPKRGPPWLRCRTTYDLHACNLRVGQTYATADGESVAIRMEGSDRATQRDKRRAAMSASVTNVTRFDAYASPCVRGEVYRDAMPKRKRNFKSRASTP